MTDDVLLRSLARLPRARPDEDCDRRILRRCHAALARRQHPAPTERRGAGELLPAAASIVGLVVLYFADVIRLYR